MTRQEKKIQRPARRCSAAAGLLGIALAVLVPCAYADELPRLVAAPSTEPLQLDGILDEPAWSRAVSAELTQASPRPGQATPFSTTVRVVVASDRH